MRSPYFSFEPGFLGDMAVRYRDAFRRARPFPCVVIDNLFPDEVAERLLAELPPLSELAFAGSRDEPRRQGKYMSTTEAKLGDFTTHVLHHLNASPFLEFLESLTGIQGLLPDPDVRLSVRQYSRGACLGIHADANWHAKLRLDRRLNFILYLNKTWRPEWGGNLELWDAGLTRCERDVAPLFNRSIIFAATETGYHGFPDPVRCPDGETRKTLQLYYYTNGRPSEERVPPHGTRFRWRPGESWLKQGATTLPALVLKKVTPPILADLAKATVRRWRVASARIWPLA
jgi:hypothetical protein